MSTAPNSSRAARLGMAQSHPRSRLHSRVSHRGSRSRPNKELLDNFSQKLTNANESRDVHLTLTEMIEVLRDVKLDATPEEWSNWISAVREHELLGLLHQDPFSQRSYRKPRGYSGDAVLLDYIYGIEERWPKPVSSRLGSLIYDYTTRAPAPCGVRARRAFIARQIDQLVERRRLPDILSVAAGHFREALLCQSVKRRKLGRAVALDSDPLSLDVVNAEYGPLGVETINLNIRSLVRGSTDLGRFDLIYSLGLFDYLGDHMSRRLVKNLFDRLKPQGRLIVANFLPGIHDLGYMEAVMDWHLIYRDRQSMIEMTMEIEQEEILDIHINTEENQNIIFVDITKR